MKGLKEAVKSLKQNKNSLVKKSTRLFFVRKHDSQEPKLSMALGTAVTVRSDFTAG